MSLFVTVTRIQEFLQSDIRIRISNDVFALVWKYFVKRKIQRILNYVTSITISELHFSILRALGSDFCLLVQHYLMKTFLQIFHHNNKKTQLPFVLRMMHNSMQKVWNLIKKIKKYWKHSIHCWFYFNYHGRLLILLWYGIRYKIWSVGHGAINDDYVNPELRKIH